MNIISNIILAIIQGIAEFLPISSSAHLIIFRDLFGIGKGMSTNLELTYDIALHLGTLLAIIIFFHKEVGTMLKDGLTKGTKTSNGKLFWYLIAATIPAGLMGVLFQDKIEGIIRSNYIIIGIALIFMGIVIYLVDKEAKTNREIKDVTLKDALIIGCSQIFALIPGFSRSGTTIAASRALKINREDAAKFSFYLSLPVVAGAVLWQLIKVDKAILLANAGALLIGIIVSCLTGLICISWLLKYLNKHDFKIFMLYRLILGTIVIIMAVI
jgi:undecaprenyl-diphosphatase